MGDSVVTRVQKTTLRDRLKKEFGIHMPERLVSRLKYDQLKRILAILQED